MYNGYTETQAQTEARRARIDANIEQLRIRDEMIAEVLPMLGALQSAVAGTFIVDDNGVDAVDAQRWLDAPTIEDITVNGYAFNSNHAKIENDMRQKLADEYNKLFTKKQAKAIAKYDDGLDTSIIGK